jgi:2-hydroxychromene-2-carboxylate isomerase
MQTASVIDFYFDFGSPTTYLAFCELSKVAERTGATISWHPVLLGGIFKLSGNQSPALNPAKARWMVEDLQRWAALRGVPLRPRGIPANTLALLRVAISLRDDPRFLSYCRAVFDGLWRDGLQLPEDAAFDSLLANCGLSRAEFDARSADPQARQALLLATEAAVKRGLFGVPTFFVGGQMHFGQDRIDWVERACS